VFGWIAFQLFIWLVLVIAMMVTIYVIFQNSEEFLGGLLGG